MKETLSSDRGVEFLLVRNERGIWDEDRMHSSTERDDPLGLHIVSTYLTHTSPYYKYTPQLY